jgi:hypothetical protein
MNLDVGLFTDCDTSTSFTGPDDSADTSSFVLVLHPTCLEAAEAAMICWSSAPEDCAVVAAPEGFFLDVPSLSRLMGQTIDVGLLTPRTIDVPDVPPHGDGAPGVGGLPPTGVDSGQQGGYGWLLWAGIAALGAGLALGVVTFATARKR